MRRGGEREKKDVSRDVIHFTISRIQQAVGVKFSKVNYTKSWLGAANSFRFYGRWISIWRLA